MLSRATGNTLGCLEWSCVEFHILRLCSLPAVKILQKPSIELVLMQKWSCMKEKLILICSSRYENLVPDAGVCYAL